MSDIAIRVEDLSKQYRLGSVGTGTLSHDLNRWWHRVRGKEDPYAKVGAVNDRTAAADSEYVWALRDINFEVKKGEVLGIIGRNGAGKSTLLKILSKITAPSTGRIYTQGRIASLLEVGTGFHPELTGRENIFLNGAIMGMKKSEIRAKFDEIVDFSGVERYIDTPVKRYSSGMYVRLAFAVAAHLEPEILIVDEVLAVGDAEFQKKCLGKMQDVSVKDGRTVLFVSHNMDAVQRLCKSSIIMETGTVRAIGQTDMMIDTYLKENTFKGERIWTSSDAPGDAFARLLSVRLLDCYNNIKTVFSIEEDVFIEMQYEDKAEQFQNTAIVHILDAKNNTLFASNEFNNPIWSHLGMNRGVVRATCRIPGNFLAEGSYHILAAINSYNPEIIHCLVEDVVSFKVEETYSGNSVRAHVSESWPGLVRPMLQWDIQSDGV